jgi:hypothetical protein
MILSRMWHMTHDSAEAGYLLLLPYRPMHVAFMYRLKQRVNSVHCRYFILWMFTNIFVSIRYQHQLVYVSFRTASMSCLSSVVHNRPMRRAVHALGFVVECWRSIGRMSKFARGETEKWYWTCSSHTRREAARISSRSARGESGPN